MWQLVSVARLLFMAESKRVWKPPSVLQYEHSDISHAAVLAHGMPTATPLLDGTYADRTSYEWEGSSLQHT